MINAGIAILPFGGTQVFNATSLEWEGITVDINYAAGETTTTNPVAIGDIVVEPLGAIWEVKAVTPGTGNGYSLNVISKNGAQSADNAPSLGGVSRGGIMTPKNGMIAPHWDATKVDISVGRIASLFSTDVIASGETIDDVTLASKADKSALDTTNQSVVTVSNALSAKADTSALATKLDKGAMAASTVAGSVKMSLTGTTLHIRNDGGNA